MWATKWVFSVSFRDKTRNTERERERERESESEREGLFLGMEI